MKRLRVKEQGERLGGSLTQSEVPGSAGSLLKAQALQEAVAMLSLLAGEHSGAKFNM